MDPAEQWVFNPGTGSYELRPAGRPRARTEAPTGTRQPQRGAPPRQRRPVEPDERRAPETDEPSPARRHRGDPVVPPQRDRRASRSRRKPKKRSGKKKALMWIGGTLGFVLIAVLGTALYAYNRLNNNITTVDTPFDNPFASGEPVNILLIGSDERVGDGNDGYGDRDSLGHAETTVLMHFSEDRKHATAMSIPRDLITDIPDCETIQPDGSVKVIPGDENVRFNESYGQKGRDPGCTWKTVQEITGIEINHFMLADFNAVKTLSTAVGGVEVCLEKDIDDPKSHLKLPAGRHVVEGEEALAFVRTRDSVGQSSDLSRIELQQQFLGSMAREMQASGSLTDPGKLWDLADAVTKALTVDSGIGDIQKLNDLAQELGQVSTDKISFVTLPVVDNPAEEVAATVVLDTDRALPLFQMINEGIALTDDGEPAGEDGGGDGKNGDDKPEPVPAAEVRVDVFNGGAETGAAQDTVSWMQNDHAMVLASNEGNAIDSEGDLAESQSETTLDYGPDQAGQAVTLAELMGLPSDALREGSEAAGETPMRLVLGADFRGAGVPIEVIAEKPDDLDSVTAEDDLCAK